MLHKRPLAGNRFQVTFQLAPIEGAEQLYLCGDFNEWKESSTSMTRAADGSWSVALTLEAGRSYRFRYRDNAGRWHNDPSADAYVPNAFGSEDSVLDLAAQAAAQKQMEAARLAQTPTRGVGRSVKKAPQGKRHARAAKKPPSRAPVRKKKRG